MDALQENPALSTLLDSAEDNPRENWDDAELEDDPTGEEGESDNDDDWDDDDWDDDEDEDEDEESSDDTEDEEDWDDDDEWDDDVPLESRFRALTSFDDEDRIRRARPASDSAPRRDQVNRPARGGVRRDARPEKDDDAGTD